MALVPGDSYARGHGDRALRFATARQLALVIMVEAPSRAQADGPVHDIVDSADIEAVFAAATSAVATARAGYGPQTVICRRPSIDDEAISPVGDADPVTLALHRLAGNPGTRGLFGPLHREVAASVRAAEERVQSLPAGSRRRGAVALARG
jgi:hypothetical protein